MFAFRPVLKSFALLFFVVPSSSVFAQEVEGGDDSLLMTNFNAMREEGQGFYHEETSLLFGNPARASTSLVVLHWYCDLEFSSDDDATSNPGYVGRAVGYSLGSSLEDKLAQGAQSFPSKKLAHSISAVLVPTLGIFEGQIHTPHDDWVGRYWDDGSRTLPFLGWDTISAWSSSGNFTKISTEAAAELLGMEVTDMTPAACSMEYEAAWNATHVPDPIDTSATRLEETVAQLQARIVALEGGLTSSPSTAWYEHATMDVVMKSIMTVAVIIGLVAVDFI